MDNLSKRLNCLIDVYGKVKFTNELDEISYKYDIVKSIWSEILPTGGNVKASEGDTVYAEVSHKITIRSNIIPNLSNDMYFVYNSQRFDIKFTQPNYKYKDRIEIMCSLVVE